jgi:hypothetical protein
MFRIYVALLLAATALHAQQMETASQVSQKVSAGEVLIRTAQILSSAEAVLSSIRWHTDPRICLGTFALSSNTSSMP